MTDYDELNRSFREAVYAEALQLGVDPSRLAESFRRIHVKNIEAVLREKWNAPGGSETFPEVNANHIAALDGHNVGRQIVDAINEYNGKAPGVSE